MRSCPKPDKFKLCELPRMIESGEISIPQFQRKYVWDIEDCAKLFDSVFKGYPIGTVTLWMTQERMRHVKKIAGKTFPTPKAGYPVNYVLDGQQRLTSIYVSLRGVKINNGDKEVDYSKLYLLLDSDDNEDGLVVTKVNNLPKDSYISIKDLFEFNYSKLNGIYGPKMQQIADRKEQLGGFEIPSVELTNTSLSEATDIFTRINTTGKKLSVFEVMSAKVYRESPHFDLIEKRDAQKEAWRASGFESLPDYVTLQAMALCLKKSCTKDSVLGMSCQEVASNWNKVDKAFANAIDYLRTTFNVPLAELLPYDVLIIPIVYFMYKNKGKKPTASQTKWLKDYFWRSALTQRFSNAVASKLTTDVAYFEAVVKNKTPEKTHLPAVTITPKKISSDGSFKTIGSFIKAMLCLFVSKRPKSLPTGSNVVVDSSWISKKNSKNYHHFFPIAYMNQSGWKNSAYPVDHIANIVIIDSADNQSIKAKAPSEYVAMFKKQNPDVKSALESHLIDDVVGFGINKNNYKKFFESRISRMCEELSKCVVKRTEDEISW